MFSNLKSVRAGELSSSPGSSSSELSATQRHSLDHARALYEVPLPDELLDQHGANQERVAAAIHAYFADQPGAVLPQDRPGKLAADLYDVLNTAQFDPDVYLPKRPGEAHGYGKYLLFTDGNLGVPYCLQVFAFAPEQKTPIHDHPCSCTSVVFQGRLKERLYQPNGDGTANKIAKRIREEGSTEALRPDQPNVHSLKNHSGQRAVSVHLYRLDGVGQPAAVREVYVRSPKASVVESARRAH